MPIDSTGPVIAAGYRRMAGSTVCVAALARDCAPALRANLPFVDALCSRFKRANVVIVENDSKDGTKEALRAWASGRPHVTLLLDDFGTVTVPPATASPVNPSYSRYRIEKLAAYRNKYLDHAGTLTGLDYLIVLDIDLYSFDLDGIAHAFGQTIPWDAQFANGRICDPCRPELGDFYWDTYAFWEVGDQTPQTEAKMSGYWRQLKPLAKGMPLFAVQSAFAGLGVYRWEAVSGVRYDVQQNYDSRVEVVVEHTCLHRRMIGAGYSRLFINPSMLAYYNRLRSPLALQAERISGVVRRNGVGGTARKLASRLFVTRTT